MSKKHLKPRNILTEALHDRIVDTHRAYINDEINGLCYRLVDQAITAACGPQYHAGKGTEIVAALCENIAHELRHGEIALREEGILE